MRSGRLSENEGVIERGRVERGKRMKKKIACKINYSGFAVFVCVYAWSVDAFFFFFMFAKRGELCNQFLSPACNQQACQ